MESGWTNRDEGYFVQLNIEHIAVQKENGTNGLILGGGGNGFLVDEVGDEGIDLGYTHLAGMPLMMMQDILPHPGEVGLFGTE